MGIIARARYGAVRGGHTDAVIDFSAMSGTWRRIPSVSNIAAVALSGARHLNREEILATAGVTGRASLLFFDVADARAASRPIPGSRKRPSRSCLPDRLVISITEREPFALWQKAGRVG
jgi:cell division protein FtsQ